MAKQANFTHASEALDFLVNQAAKDNVTDEEAVREMAAYLRVKSEMQDLQRQLAAAREALQAAEADAERYRCLISNTSVVFTDYQSECPACNGSGEGPEVTYGYGDETRGVMSTKCPACDGSGTATDATLQRDRQP